jgi:hypothetical protein
VQEQDGFGWLPRIGEIVDLVIETETRRFQDRHWVLFEDFLVIRL